MKLGDVPDEVCIGIAGLSGPTMIVSLCAHTYNIHVLVVLSVVLAYLISVYRIAIALTFMFY